MPQTPPIPARAEVSQVRLGPDAPDGPLPTPALEASALYSLRCVINWGSWVHRRVEQVDISHDAHFRRQTSVDCTPPAWSVPVSASPVGRAPVVPVVLLRKELLNRFSLRSSQGSPMPILTTAQNAQVQEAMLVLAAKLVLALRFSGHRGTGSVRLDSVTRTVIANVVSSTAVDAEATLLRASIEATRSPSNLSWILKQPLFRNLLTDFSKQYLIHAVTDAPGGRRTIFKMYLEEQLVPDKPTTIETAALAARRDSRYGLDMVLRSLDFLGTSAPVSVALYQAPLCSSYHIEVRVPRPLVISAVRVLQGANPVRLTSFRQYDSEYYCHFTIRFAETTPVLQLNLRPAADGMLATVAYMSLVSGALVLGGLALRYLGGFHSASSVAGPVLVVVPSLYAGFLAARSPDPVVEVIIRRARLVVGVLAAVNFLDAASLVVYRAGSFEWRGWLWLGSLVVFAAVGGMAVRSRFLGRPKV